jgi:hypothetical protein
LPRACPTERWRASRTVAGDHEALCAERLNDFEQLTFEGVNAPKQRFCLGFAAARLEACTHKSRLFGNRWLMTAGASAICLVPLRARNMRRPPREIMTLP